MNRRQYKVAGKMEKLLEMKFTSQSHIFSPAVPHQATTLFDLPKYSQYTQSEVS